MENEQYRVEGKNGFILITDRGEGKGAQILVNTGFNVAIIEISDIAVGVLADSLNAMCGD